MVVKRYEHSCLDITEGNSRLVIDPGIFSHSFTNNGGISVLVITHIHPDHFDQAKVRLILKSNPDIQIFTTEEVAKELKSDRVIVPERTKPYSVGPFNLKFYGEKHGIVDPNIVFQNIGVLVNDKLYYPGDSLTACDTSFSTLAQTAAAPWLLTADIPDFLDACDCRQVFLVHDGLLNEDGIATYRKWIGGFVESKSKKFLATDPGESIQI